MSNEAEAVRLKWQRLRDGTTPATEFQVPSLALSLGGGLAPARLAVDERGHACLLLPINPSARLADAVLPSALNITTVRVENNGQQLRLMSLACVSADLEGVFSEYVDEVVARIRAGSGCIEACSETTKSFRLLLDNSAAVAVDASTVRGLAAELVYLSRLLEISSRAAEAWLGPTGDRHDFRAGNRAVEVKATTRETSLVRISSLEQLMEPPQGSLLLVRLVLETTPAGSLTIDSCVKSVLARTSDPALVLSRLTMLGCADHESPVWNSLAFNLVRTDAFRVEAAFPRITPTNFVNEAIPAGTREFEYSIDLSLAADLRLDAPALLAADEDLIKCLLQS